MNCLRRSEAMVIRNREIMGGVPVIRGTRIPVHLVAEMRRQGASAEEILAGYPSLTSEQIELAELYARAYPQLARKRGTQLPDGARLISRKTCPLRCP